MIAGNDKKSLLPPHSTPLEHALAATTSRIDTIPVPVRNLWNPDLLHVDFLPFLAWALSVDAWDSSWTEDRKRHAIKAAIALHRVKGTPAALKTALNALELGVQVKEWFEYGGKPYHFRLDVELSDSGLNESEIATIEAVALAVKNERSKLEVLKVWLSGRGRMRLAAHGSMREDGLVYPRQETELSQSGHLRTGAATSVLEVATMNRHRTPAANGDGEPTHALAPRQPILLDKVSTLLPPLGTSRYNPIIVRRINLYGETIRARGIETDARVFYFEVPQIVILQYLKISNRFPPDSTIVIINRGAIDAPQCGVWVAPRGLGRHLVVHNYGRIKGVTEFCTSRKDIRISLYRYGTAYTGSTDGVDKIYPRRPSDAPPIPYQDNEEER